MSELNSADFDFRFRFKAGGQSYRKKKAEPEFRPFSKIEEKYYS